MTEQEWMESAEPVQMLGSIWQQLGKRKQRLLVVGYCRQVWDLLSEVGRRPVDVAERFADGHATLRELEEAEWLADSNAVDVDGHLQQAEQDSGLPSSDPDNEFAHRELMACRQRLHAAMLAHTSTFTDELLEFRDFRAVVGIGQQDGTADLVRCLFGNPFRPAIVNPAWHTATVVSLATAIYDERAFDRLPILADALEDAGCDHTDILNHCRQPGDHVRGCWVVDLLLAKE